jgi:uncharacterized SAM-binding protein YcdF (DUF218 family)
MRFSLELKQIFVVCQTKRMLLPFSILTFIILTFFTRYAWLPLVEQFLTVADPLHPADAIVPLAGGVERAKYTARLHQDGYAAWFVATDIEQPLDWEAALPADTPIARLALEQGVAQQHILTTAAPVTSTYTEALAVRDLAQREGWQSLIVVTSPSHTRRSRAIFRSVFTGTGITVSIRPSIGEKEADEAWWRDQDEREFVLREYAKLFAFCIGYHR